MKISESYALKEWKATVQVLAAGQTLLLLRKGGIHEPRFTLPQRRAWLLPTLEHQRPAALKPQFQWAAQPVETPRGSLHLSAWAELTPLQPITHPETLAALDPYLIWTPTWVAERWAWQPGRSLWALLLRVYVLDHPVFLADHPSYRGCRSWVRLLESLQPEAGRPVLSEREYTQQSASIEAVLALTPGKTGESAPSPNPK